MHECRIILEQRYVAPKLSHNSCGGSCIGTCNSVRRFFSHIITVVVVATTRYLASVDDLACALFFRHPRNLTSSKENEKGRS